MSDKGSSAPSVQIDIVSDIMCPWCIIGFRQLEQALKATGIGAFIRWHPFELNPTMPSEGQNLREHIVEKYGATAEQSAENRAQLRKIGEDLGIDFKLGDDSRIFNTFQAHQLLDWAQKYDKQHPLELALFAAHFSDGRDVSRQEVLVDVADSVGLDRDLAQEVLESRSHAADTRARQEYWTSRGISGVPAMVFDGKYLLTGAQGAQNYAQMLQKVVTDQRAEQSA
ncbi:DsbA family oxidoreductase [uncultured Sulfitobacter sp.]|uniref:DsbA family oxidoreductase n=1 Tax=uncultured Sulfitobacter sp. TaxID=191468 RepID=UPI0026316170|nr:DsbA family oxidoreductase [uncultured Sulfitobacter sp.]